MDGGSDVRGPVGLSWSLPGVWYSQANAHWPVCTGYEPRSRVSVPVARRRARVTRTRMGPGGGRVRVRSPSYRSLDTEKN